MRLSGPSSLTIERRELEPRLRLLAHGQHQRTHRQERLPHLHLTLHAVDAFAPHGPHQFAPGGRRPRVPDVGALEPPGESNREGFGSAAAAAESTVRPAGATLRGASTELGVFDHLLEFRELLYANHPPVGSIVRFRDERGEFRAERVPRGGDVRPRPFDVAPAHGEHRAIKIDVRGEIDGVGGVSRRGLEPPRGSRGGGACAAAATRAAVASEPRSGFRLGDGIRVHLHARPIAEVPRRLRGDGRHLSAYDGVAAHAHSARARRTRPRRSFPLARAQLAQRLPLGERR